MKYILKKLKQFHKSKDNEKKPQKTMIIPIISIKKYI